MSHPGYPNAISVNALIERLVEATGNSAHEFWPDDISLLDPKISLASRIHGPRQITDLYLLALAVSRGGRFVTFDTSIPMQAIRGAQQKHLVGL